MPAALAAHRNQEVASRGTIDGAGDHDSCLLDRDQRSPERHAANEAPRAIDRIDDPTTMSRVAFASELLTKDGIVRKQPMYARAGGGLCFSIGPRHFRAVGLQLHNEPLPEMAEGDVAAGARDLLHGPVERRAYGGVHSERGSTKESDYLGRL